jgi:hypothetical protein
MDIFAGKGHVGLVAVAHVGSPQLTGWESMGGHRQFRVLRFAKKDALVSSDVFAGPGRGVL